MERFDDAILQAIPDPALITCAGRIVCFNPAAAGLFPGLANGAPAPDPLPARPHSAGYLVLDGRSWQLSSAAMDDRLLILLHPTNTPGAPAPQLAGTVRCLREQMGQLLLNIQLLSRSSSPDADPRLASMNRTLCQMLRLVNHIDLLENLDAGTPPFCPVTLDLAGLGRQMADVVGSLLEQAGIALEFDCPAASVLVSGDSELLQTLLLELLSNAAQAAGRGSTLHMSLSFRHQRALLSVSGRCVQDDGRSLSHLLAGLVEETRIPLPGEGAGLGLLLARRIVCLHQGALLMERQEESGVNVTLALPIAQPGASLPVRTPTRDYSGGFSPELVAFSSVLEESAFSALDVE